MKLSDFFKKYQDICDRQRCLKVRYEKEFADYKETLDYGIRHGVYDVGVVDSNQYTAAFRSFNIEEMKRILFDKLNADYMKHFSRMENEKRDLVKAVGTVGFSMNMQCNKQRYNVCSIQVCFMLMLICYILGFVSRYVDLMEFCW